MATYSYGPYSSCNDSVGTAKRLGSGDDLWLEAGHDLWQDSYWKTDAWINSSGHRSYDCGLTILVTVHIIMGRLVLENGRMLDLHCTYIQSRDYIGHNSLNA